MTLANDRLSPDGRAVADARADADCLRPAGVSSGVNIAPGVDDDGWIVPPPVRLADGTRVQLYKDGEALHAAFDAIRGARDRVCLEFYIFADDDTGRAFADLLCAKARQGVRTYVIYDSFGSRGLMGREPDMFRRMRGAGVRVRQFHPMRPWECSFSWRPANRDHRKLVVVDDDQAGLGGLNIGAEYAGTWVTRAVRAVRAVRERHPIQAMKLIGSGPASKTAGPGGLAGDPWRDNAISVHGPGARMFLRAFANSWQYVTHGGRIGTAAHRHNLYEGELGVLASVPSMNSPLRPALHRLMREARHSLLMTMAYFAPDDELIEELCKAGRRGVRVRLMLPGVCDVPAVRLAAHAFYETLMSCGVEIFERQSVVLHAKTMVADGRISVIGSTNLDYRSIEYNLELSAVVRSETFGRQMHALFESDVRFATRIDPAAWRRRPYRDRAVQWAVSRARYLL